MIIKAKFKLKVLKLKIFLRKVIYIILKEYNFLTMKFWKEKLNDINFVIYLFFYNYL